jgi:Zn-finger nucleic acid-binding protein
MADDVFRQTRKKITADEARLQQQPQQPPFEAPMGEAQGHVNPMDRIRQIQEEMADDGGEEQVEKFQQTPFRQNPDLAFQIGGNVPPAFREAMQRKGNPVPAQPSPGEISKKGPQPKVVKMAAPADAGQSDALEALLEQLGERIAWDKIELPSKGKFYDNIPGQLHVRPMTGEEEQILATPRHVRRGKAIDLIFQKCVKEPINTEELLSMDRTYLLIFLRGISYTPEYDVEIKCPECSTKFNTMIDLNAIEVDGCPDDFGVEQLTGTLPTTGWTFRYRLPTGKDELAVNKYREERVKNFGDQSEDDTLLYRTALMLEEIQGVTNTQEIKYLLSKLPINDVAHLRNVVSDPPFGVDTAIGMMCPQCNAEFEVDLPLEANFFFPRKKKQTHQ